jgi:hypothetical protein
MADVYTYRDFENKIEFYKNGKLHRDGDKPAVVLADCRKEWWIDGRRFK